MAISAKRRLVVLAVASVAAVLGLVWLGAQIASQGPRWVLAGLASPLGARCAVIIAVGVAVLGLVAAVLVRTGAGSRARPCALHGDQVGTAAVEMAFVFPIGLMVFLILMQAALLFNANMVVHYAAFAAARMAIVAVPMDMEDTEEWANLVWPATEDSQGQSAKLELIRRAAVLALTPVSAPLEGGAAGGTTGSTLGSVDLGGATRQAFQFLEAKNRAWFRRIQRQYQYADTYTKIELAEPEHWRNDGDPDNDCPYRHHQRDQWTQWGWSYTPYCPFYHKQPPIWDFYYYEDLHVRVTYPFLLQVPYASRFLGEPMTVPGRSGRSYAATIRVTGTLTNEGGPELRPEDAPVITTP